MFHTAFTNKTEIKDYRDTLDLDRVKLGKFVAGMHDRGIRIIGRGLWYISAAHTAEDIDHTVDTAAEVFSNI
jgi:glutamate-1-semialdehyde 2,1-aminomutase